MARPAILREFVRKHLGLTNAEIADKAKAEGIALDASKVASHRYHINAQGKPKRKPAKAKLAKSKPVKAKANGLDTVNTAKESALRKLIFELGFDAARKVFEEFELLHRSMTH